MKRRQPLPTRWLVADERAGEQLWAAVRKLPRGSGVLVLHRSLPKGERAALLSRLRRVARQRGLAIADEAAGASARVHDLPELRRASLRRKRLLFLSPVFATRSHPGRKALPTMKAAAMIRLAPMPVLALGGMDERRFRRVERLGFQGWAGIDAWIRT
jgi:thiamine-phosphate pyrophosphorylase